MATRAYSVLGQADSVNGSVDAYVVPALTQSVISSIVLANQSGSDKVVTVRIRKAGASATTKQIIFPAGMVKANDIVALQLGVTLGAADVITVTTDNTSIAINVFGYQFA